MSADVLACTKPLPTFDMAQGLLHRTFMGQRTNEHPIRKSTAHFQRLDLVGECLCEAVVDTILDEDPVRRDAGLSRVAEFGQDTRFHGSLDLSIVEYNEGTVSAKLNFVIGD